MLSLSLLTQLLVLDVDLFTLLDELLLLLLTVLLHLLLLLLFQDGVLRLVVEIDRLLR
jgi:hypothetical protein